MSHLLNHVPYDPQYYADRQTAVEQSAAVIVPEVVKLVRPTSVIDVGCGSGAWAAAFMNCGIVDVLGVDGAYMNPHGLAIPAAHFVACDLTEDFAGRLARRFDLAVCLEVAEHLPPTAADHLVRGLTRVADTVLFSAAIPGQGGRNHVNERWQSYWNHHFSSAGFTLIDAVRPRVWANPAVAVWYRQNTFVYTCDHEIARRFSNPNLLLDVVHPELWKRAVGKLNARSDTRTLRELLPEFSRAIARSFRSRTYPLRAK